MQYCFELRHRHLWFVGALRSHFHRPFNYEVIPSSATTTHKDFIIREWSIKATNDGNGLFRQLYDPFRNKMFSSASSLIPTSHLSVILPTIGNHTSALIFGGPANKIDECFFFFWPAKKYPIWHQRHFFLPPRSHRDHVYLPTF